MTISSTVGPISGIDYGKLITGLMGIEQQPIDQINSRLAILSAKKDAFTQMTAQLSSFKLLSASFMTSAVFRSTSATSSNSSVLSATSDIGTPVGSYNFSVMRLATASQQVTTGFADSTSTALGVSGDLVFGFGKGTLNPVMKLADLNGGAGVARGSIRITDTTGASATVDLSRAVDLNDVVTALNSASGLSLTASIRGDKLYLSDNAAGGGTLRVLNTGTTTTASDLGLTTDGDGVAATVTGTDINKLRTTSSVNLLNDGNGLRVLGGASNDLTMNVTRGMATFNINVSLGTASTINDVINKFNTAATGAGQAITASLATDGHSLVFTDTSGSPADGISFTDLSTSKAVEDLGLSTGSYSAGVYSGDRVNGGLDSVMLRSLHGGSGINSPSSNPGKIKITNRAGVVSGDINLTAAKTVQDVVDAINATVTGVTASLNSSGTGLLLTDTTNSTASNLIVANSTGATTTAADLGFGTALGVATATYNGGDLHTRYISGTTALSTFNAGAGFTSGKIQITSRAGTAYTVDLSSSSLTSVQNVLDAISTQTGGLITGSINSNGNGILLTDSSGGGGTASVAEVNSGTTAASLGIFGTFSGTTLDGSQQKRVTIANTDKLSDIATKINQANIGISATIINDGSGSTPYRLSLASRASGGAGNLIFDGSALGLSSTVLTTGQDAALLFGNGSSVSNLMVTSKTNQVTGLATSLTVNLLSTSSSPVSVAVARDDSQVSKTVQSFVDSYNKIWTQIQALTKFDASNPSQHGLLFGDSTIQEIQQGLSSMVNMVFTNTGSVKTLGAVGITVQQDGSLKYDSAVLQSQLISSSEDIRLLFTKTTYGVGDQFNSLLSKFTDGSSGLLFYTTDTLTTQATALNKRATFLNTILESKKQRLQLQFANLETNISKMQQQGSALNSFSSGTTSTSSSSSSGK